MTVADEETSNNSLMIESRLFFVVTASFGDKDIEFHRA